MLIAFDKGDDSRAAFELLRTTLRQSGSQIRRTVGFPGGNHEKEVTWHASARFWSLLDPEEARPGRVVIRQPGLTCAAARACRPS